MFTMAKTMTVNVDEKTMERFRRFVRAKYGKRKGALGRAASDAFNALVAKSESERANEHAIMLLRKGFRLGKIIGTREDWHAR